MLRNNKEATKRELRDCQFEKLDSTSVITNRNFNLYRGRTLQEAVEILHVNSEQRKISDSRRSSSTDDQDQCPTAGSECSSGYNSDATPKSPPANSAWNKNQHPMASREIKRTYGDKSSSHWVWPLGEAKVVSTNVNFEVKLSFKPFKASEIRASVMGSELIIQCKVETPSSCVHPTSREVLRCYQLPVNLIPSSVQFIVLEAKQELIVRCEKEQPLKLALA